MLTRCYPLYVLGFWGIRVACSRFVHRRHKNKRTNQLGERDGLISQIPKASNRLGKLLGNVWAVIKGRLHRFGNNVLHVNRLNLRLTVNIDA